ncbi:MAG: hypothetical protein K1X55_15225 [Chitinophagales bacterium]|nr:hypothetical protein [Chitinophagales bacterium]
MSHPFFIHKTSFGIKFILLLLSLFMIQCNTKKLGIKTKTAKEYFRPVLIIDQANFKKNIVLIAKRKIYFNELRIYNIGKDSLIQILDDIIYVKPNSLTIGDIDLSNIKWTNNASLQNLRHVNLINTNIDTLPLIFIDLESLESIDISYNPTINLELLFNQCLNYSKLGSLSVEYCNISKIPNSICTLPKLFMLSFIGNELKELPPCVFKLHNIKQINLEMNKFTEDYKSTLKDSLSFIKFIYLYNP